jgi:hypothetical protein
LLVTLWAAGLLHVLFVIVGFLPESAELEARLRTALEHPPPVADPHPS